MTRDDIYEANKYLLLRVKKHLEDDRMGKAVEAEAMAVNTKLKRERYANLQRDINTLSGHIHSLETVIKELF